MHRLGEPGHTLITSSLLLDEVGRVLRYPRLQRLHGLTGVEIDRFVADVAAASLLVEPASALAEHIVASDPDDDPIIAAAVTGKADVLCTLDKHLYQPVVIEHCTNHGIRVMRDIELLAHLRSVG
ncbi:MAG: putative toxin-antitoxin system toxin component, PIN family [Planctomycetes bacterium]|nr:putative toxin-antitoxin system toxin component, PIN family [Planctomycetota bacterium]